MIHSIKLGLLGAVSVLLLAACGGGGGGESPAHEETFIDTAGRLAMTEQDGKTVRLHDLDNAAAVEAAYAVEHVPSAIHASPQGRYAVVVQRLQDQVRFVDGGIWQEDHGDHLHDYKQASKAMSWKLAGARPTHYDVQAGKQAAFFMDGNAAASPVQNAAIRSFNDAGIASGRLMASLDLAFPIHGMGEPVDNRLLTVSRADDAIDSLPTHLNLYLRDGSTYVKSRQLPTRCDAMHGSFSSGSYTLTGCLDGMLLVRHTGATTVDDGRKLTTALRVSTIAGHARSPGYFIGIATEGAAPDPVTTRFYAVDAANASVSTLAPQGWEAGRVRRAHGFDRSGQRFYVLDDRGSLFVMQRQGAAWITVAEIADAIPDMPAAAPWPVIVANGAKDEIYLTDPVARQLVAVHAVTGAVLSRRNLGYVPSGAAWLGIAR